MIFIRQYELAGDQGFLGRIRQAIVKQALMVVAEAPNIANHQERATFAKSVLQNPSGIAHLFAIGVATSDTVQGGMNDAEMTAVVVAMWNAYAGIVTA